MSDPRQLAYEAQRRTHREGWWVVRLAWCEEIGVDPVTGSWLVEPEVKQWESRDDQG